MKRFVFLLIVVQSTGCGNVTISGTVSLPPGMTAAPSMSCSDIEVAAFNRFLDSQDEIVSVASTGDITTGHCQFSMSLRSGGSVEVGSRPYHVSEIQYTDCPDKFRTTFITEQTVSLLLPFDVTLDLQMEAPRTGCP